MIRPAIARASDPSERDVDLQGDPEEVWTLEVFIVRIRATEESTTAIEGRYSDELREASPPPQPVAETPEFASRWR